MTNRTRTERITLRLSKEEKDFIKRKMNESRMYNYTDFIIKAICGTDYFVVDTRPLLEIAGEINSIGTNINQIAKVANTSRSIYGEEISALQENIMDLIYIVQQNLMMFEKAKEGENIGVHKNKTYKDEHPS